MHRSTHLIFVRIYISSPLPHKEQILSERSRPPMRNNYAKNSGLKLPRDIMQTYFFQVWISNGALNSSATKVPSTTWPLPPTPVVTGFTNTSFSVTVPLSQMHFPALFEINIEVCARAYTWTAGHRNILPLRIYSSMMNFCGFSKRRAHIYILPENTPTYYHTACATYILALPYL